MEIIDKGKELNITLRQGATFGPVTCTLTNNDTPTPTPLNITGYTFRAQIRKSPTSRKATGCSAVCTVQDAVNGVFTLEFTAAATAALLAGDTEDSAESIYSWDMEMETSLGRVVPLVYGTAKVFREVTKTV